MSVADGVPVVPAVYAANVSHIRRQRLKRAFRHRTAMWLVDLDALPVLPWWLRPLARFEAGDHMGDPSRSLRANLDEFLAAHGVHLDGGRLLMLTHPRVLGHVFNPISVYWCHRREGGLACVVAEVHNTYRQRHRYLLFPDGAGRAEITKEFYVSPFLTVDGRYAMTLREPGARLAVAVTLHQEGRAALVATLTGTRIAAGPTLRRAGALRAFLRRPFVPQRTSLLIRRHGVALWLRGLPIVLRPATAPQEEP